MELKSFLLSTHPTEEASFRCPVSTPPPLLEGLRFHSGLRLRRQTPCWVSPPAIGLPHCLSSITLSHLLGFHPGLYKYRPKPASLHFLTLPTDSPQKRHRPVGSGGDVCGSECGASPCAIKAHV